MKKIILILFLTSFLEGHTQQGDPNVFSNLNLAKQYAAQHDIPILMVFAGSDWCKPCIQFKRSILSSDQFKSYAKNNLTILYLDFPLKKANKLSDEQTIHNEKLAEKYNPSGSFPEILLIDANENVLGKLRFKNQTPEEFISNCQTLIR